MWGYLMGQADGSSRTMQLSGEPLTDLALSPEGTLLAGCSWDSNAERGVWGVVNVWESRTGTRVAHQE